HVVARTHTAVEDTVFVMCGVREAGEPEVPQEPGPEEQDGLLQGLRAQCGDLASAPHLLEAPVYAAYGVFDAKNSVGLQRLADETIAGERGMSAGGRGPVSGHGRTAGGKGVYMPGRADLRE